MRFGLPVPTLTEFQRETEPEDGGWRKRWALAPKVARFREQARAARPKGTVMLHCMIEMGQDKAKLEREWLPPTMEIYRNDLKLGMPFNEDDIIVDLDRGPNGAQYENLLDQTKLFAREVMRHVADPCAP